MLTGGRDEELATMGAITDFATIIVPAFMGLIGWAVLRQRGTPPLLAGCLALTLALMVMTVMFVVIYFV